MKEHIRVRSKRTLPTYTRLRSVSWYSLELAKVSEKGRLSHLMTSMLFCAFTLEAFLNHLGEDRISFWEPLKRKLSPHEKLDVISIELGFEPVFGKRPFQTFRPIFKLRYLLVHAKTETITSEGEFILAEGERPPKPLTEWEELISLEGAQRFLDDTKEIIYQLATSAGMDPSNVFATEIIETTTEIIRIPIMPSS